jgi:NTP pyrophosphatase (non-canonical NTP hydrolase)
MGYMTNGLNFNALRSASIARLPQFKNCNGELAHSQPDGSDWSPAQWLQAVIGELGEYANFRKKYERGDITHSEFRTHAEKELADVQCYLTILALRCLDDNGQAHLKALTLGELPSTSSTRFPSA